MGKGIAYALAAYGLWGVFPLYFRTLQDVSSTQIVAHRVVWSFVFLLVLLAGRRQLAAWKMAVDLKRALIYLASGALLTVNWLIYIWGINAGMVVETSLGYFINPLVSVLLGVIFLREKLRPAQWVPVGLAAAGVTYLTLSYGTLPWIALALAFSFGLYGLIKKVAPLGSLFGLTLETGMVFLPALLYLLYHEFQNTGSFGHTSGMTTILLALTGVVTAVPLLFFAAGARSVPLSMIGLLQYIAPTLQFLIGVFIFHEPFTTSRLIGFSIIWLALLIFSVESFSHWRKTMTSAGKATAAGDLG